MMVSKTIVPKPFVYFGHKPHVHGPNCNHHHHTEHDSCPLPSKSKQKTKSKNPIVKGIFGIIQWFKDFWTILLADLKSLLSYSHDKTHQSKHDHPHHGGPCNHAH